MPFSMPATRALGDKVMVALVAALPAVLLGELDPVAFDAVNGSHMHAIGANDFGVFLDL